MTLSRKAEDELVELARSERFREDMRSLRAGWQNPFVKDGRIDIDAYIKFVMEFNKFINHELKPFRPMIDRDMRL